MKKLFPLVIIAIVVFTSCKKNSNEPQPVNLGAIDTNMVIVSDGSYPIIHIAGKSWTSANYGGPGGLYNTGYTEGGQIHGKLYTSQEAAQIVLPTGWRIPNYK